MLKETANKKMNSENTKSNDNNETVVVFLKNNTVIEGVVYPKWQTTLTYKQYKLIEKFL